MVLMKYLVNYSLEKPESYASGKYLRLLALNVVRQYDDIVTDVLLAQADYFSIKEK